MSTSDETPISKARLRREQLLREVEEIDVFLKMYERFADNEPQPPVTADTGSKNVVSGRMAAVEGGAERGMTQPAFTAFVRSLLKENGRPMTLQKLLDAFEANGREVGGAKPLGNMKTKLWRARDEIVRIQGAGYWLKEVPCPEVKYDPAAHDDAGASSDL